MGLVEELRSLDLQSASPKDVFDILGSYQLETMIVDIPKDVYIIRSRRGFGFTTAEEMTYCPVRYCTSLQRASLPHNTMFYGVISDDQSHQENARCISCCESSTLVRKGKDSIGRENFTLSHWVVIEPLRVMSFVTDNTFPSVKNNNLLNRLRKKIVESSGSIEDEDFIHFISEEFSKVVRNNKEYLISASLTTYMTNIFGLDGIVYPSVQMAGQAGLNIALSPDAADKKIRFIRTLGQSFYKNKNKSIIRLEHVTEFGGQTIPISNIPDDYIIQNLQIRTLDELPLVI